MKLAAALIATLSLLSCSGSSSPTAPPAYDDVAGTWDVTFTVTGGNELPVNSVIGGSIAPTVSGSGVISGSLTLASGGTGTITGMETGHHFTMTTNETSPCSSGLFDTPDGNGNMDFTGLTGTFDGTDCNGTLETTFTAVRHTP